MKYIRWLAVIPAAILAWYFVIIIGLLLLILIDSWCPPQDRISGMCIASWYAHAEKLVLVFCAALAAFLVVVSAALTAPSHRIAVAWTAYLAGLGVATSLVSADLSVEYVTALLAGLLAVAAVYWKIKNQARAD